jgi:putative ABC transport system permease protein
MRIKLVGGRAFDDRDRFGQPATTIVNEALVRAYLRGQKPLNTRIKFGRPQDNNPWVQIVGVVEDEKQDGLDKAAQPTAYSNLEQAAQDPMTFVVRTPLAPDAALESIRRQVRAVDKDLALTSIGTLQGVVDDSMGGFRFRTTLLSAFAAIAVLLAALGTYGTLAYSVSQRSHELGIRLALGARRPSLFGLVVGQGMRPVLAGTALGLAGALALTGMMRSLIFGVSTLDPLTYGVAILLLLTTGILACALPAWRAMRLDPVIALRCE